MLEIRLAEREAFVVWGYSVETDLENNDKDIGKLWDDYKSVLESLSGNYSGLYGVMWYTDETHKSYFYMLAVQIDNMIEFPENNSIQRLEIPKGLYAIASLPTDTDLVEAWTEFYFKELPARKLETNHQHGIFFEWYPVKGGIELWNPVKQLKSD